mmetsp:Transcript_12377/g.19032  ORF Transcript_12377/g.19032 Transcript_12377/m.19032 type:complete len:569 (+) Transcript_12377:110-1816(+)
MLSSSNTKRSHHVATDKTDSKKLCLLRDVKNSDKSKEGCGERRLVSEGNTYETEHLLKKLQSGLCLLDAVAHSGSIEGIIELFNFIFQTHPLEPNTLKLFLDFWTYFPEAATAVLHAFPIDGNWSKLLKLMEQGKENKVNSNFIESDLRSIEEQWRTDVKSLKYHQSDEGIRQQYSNQTKPNIFTQENNHNQNIKIAQFLAEFIFSNCKKATVQLKNDNHNIFLRKTNLYVVSSNGANENESVIILPIGGRVDEYLINSYAALREANRCFLIKRYRSFTKECSERLVYIHQGEVGHTLLNHCDIILSDMATTCHILALRSESNSSMPMTTLTHIDGTFYDDCVHKMIIAHMHYYQKKYSKQKKGCVNSRYDKELLIMDVNIVGGFDDRRSLSAKISTWLLHLLAALAERYKDVMKIRIKTCAISLMNDDGNAKPIGRGMGMDVRTGEVFLAKADLAVTGPAQQLRMAHVWAGRDTLSVVKTIASDAICIEPFFYDVFPNLNTYLKMPDHKMIKRTSTSPDAEEANFCSDVRKTLRFVRELDCARVFGPGIDHPLIFERVSRNDWKRVN